MNWQAYVEALDDSHPMTTDKRHIRMLCEIVEDSSWNILELGSHAGFSAAAMALAAPAATVTAVDLSDTVAEAMRTVYWAGLGVKNIDPVTASAGDYLTQCQPGQFHCIFHDAVHGPAAFLEYLGCAEIAAILAIHDFEQLPADMRAALAAKFSRSTTDADHKGRVLFVGYK